MQKRKDKNQQTLDFGQEIPAQKFVVEKKPKITNSSISTICVIYKNGQYSGEKDSDKKLIKDLTGLEFLSRFDLEKLKNLAAKNGILSICIIHPMPEYQPPKKHENSSN